MGITRQHHVGNYTVVDNGFIRNPQLSFKAKGMLLLLLSLPDSWKFTETWLATQSSDKVSVVKSSLKELEQFGYLRRSRERINGKLGDAIYDVYEVPMCDFLTLEKSTLENRTLLNTDIVDNSVIDKPNTNKTNTAKTIKHRFGEYGHVLLSDADVEKLKSKFPSDWEQRIKALDEGIEMKGYKYKNFYLAILKWANQEVPKDTPKKRGLREG